MAHFNYVLFGNLRVLVWLCRLIDCHDFENDRELEVRITKDDFQCGQCPICYLISRRPGPTKDIDPDD